MFHRVWEDVDQQSMFFPASKSLDLASSRSLAEQIEAKKYEFNNAKSLMEKELKKCEKIE